jgi:alpha-1,2-mannosyltransferase
VTVPSPSAGSTRPGVLRGWLRSPRRVLPVTVPVLALALTALLLHTHGYHIDLEVYRLGVWTWLDGGDMYGPLPPTISGLALPFIYPPFAAMVLAPLALVPWTVAWVGLFAASLACLAVTLYVVVRRVWPDAGPPGALALTSVALPLALVLEPVRETFEFGQVNLVLMALVAVDCLTVRTRWPRGLLVGLAAAIKLTPAAFVLFFLLRRDPRAAGVAVGTAVAATGLGFVVDPGASARYWFGGPAAGVSGSIFYTNQTVQGVVARLGAGEAVVTITWLVLTAALLLLVAPVVRRADAPLALVTLAAFALLVSPTSWSHHWVWVAPALLVAIAQAVRDRSAAWAAASGLLVVTFTVAPFHLLPQDGGRELLWSVPQQVVGATYVLVTVALLAALRRRHGRPPGRPTMGGPPVAKVGARFGFSAATGSVSGAATRPTRPVSCVPLPEGGERDGLHRLLRLGRGRARRLDSRRRAP